MIKVKDGYGKLVGDSYKGNANVMLVSDGSDVEKSITSKANTLVERNASGQIESSIATGTAPFVVTSTTKVTNLNADLLDGKHSTEFLTDDRLFTMLVPTGTAIPANADLQTTEYLKVGRYYCSANATAITLKNCPIDKAFMMEVYSPLSTTIDNETTNSYVYRLRKITHYNTGVLYWQYVGSSATAGSFTYGNWYVMPMSLHATNVNASGGSSSLGSETKPVYIDNTGRFALGNEYYSISDVYNKTEIDDMFDGFNGSIDPPGNGTITIKLNEVVVGSFTMNQSTSDEIDLINTTYEIFTGATASTNGTSGLVPSPIIGDDVKYLRGDGTWSTVPFTTNSTNSDKVYTSSISDNLTYYITFVSGNSDGYKDLKQNANLTYNPYDGVLNALSINVVNLNSTDVNSTNITATNIYIGDDKLEEIFAPITHYHDYLPLSGGTLIPENSNTPLNLKGTSDSLDSWLAFENKNEYLASIGVNSEKSLLYYVDMDSYRIFHEGNLLKQEFKINDVTYNIYTPDTITNFTIYAPTSKGETGEYLVSNGSGVEWKPIDPYDYNTKRNPGTVLAGPISGNPASATFRLLDISDIPNLSTLYLPLTGGTLTGNVTIEKASTGDCMYWTKVTDSGFTPKIGFGTGASKNRGIYDSIKGWILKIDTNNIVTFEGKAQEAFYADSAGEVPWTGITGKPDCYNPCAHQHLTDEVISLTGYTAITELPELAPNLVVSDTLNQALAKLEYKANNGQLAYIWYRSVTGEDDDAIINKWEEITKFIESVAEGTDITEEFVTTKTAQNVEGVKLFLGTMYFGNTAEFFHPVTFYDNVITTNILPGTDLSYSVGTADYKFAQMYAENFYGYLNGTADLSKHISPITTLNVNLSTKTVATVKQEILTAFSSVNTGIGANIIIPQKAVQYWNNNNTTLTESSVYSMIKIGGGYSGTTYGQWLLSTHADSRIGIVGRKSDSWTDIKWIAFTDDVTDTKNTAGSTNSTSKLYLIGATEQSANPQTYSNANIYISSNAVYASGGFFESSDERLKDFGEKVSVDLDKLSELKKNYFTWKDSENTEQQLGVSAQEIRELYPEIVSELDNGILSVAYDKLSVIALAAIDKLHEENQKLKERLIILETKLN